MNLIKGPTLLKAKKTLFDRIKLRISTIISKENSRLKKKDLGPGHGQVSKKSIPSKL